MIQAIARRYVDAYSGLPREVWFLAIVMFVNRSGTMVLPFLTLYLTSQLEMSESVAAQMMTVYGLGSLVGTYLGGRLTQRFEPIRLQAAGMFCTVPLMLIIPLWTAWWQFALSLFVMAGVYETVRPANATAITRVTHGENRARAFGLQRLAANLGFSVGPAVGGFLATYNFTLLFVVDALTMLAAAFLLVYLCSAVGSRKAESSAETSEDRSSPLSNVRFVAFLGLMLATEMVFIQYLSTYPLYLHDHFLLSKQQIGLIFAVNTSMIVLFEMVLVDYIKKWPALRCVGWGCWLSCLGFGMLPFGTSGYYCVLAMVVLTVGEMISFPVAAAYVANFGPKGKEGLYMGWFTFVHALAWVLGPFLGAVIYGYDREALWVCSLAVGVFVFVGFMVLEAFSPTADNAEAATAVEDSVQSTVAQID